MYWYSNGQTRDGVNNPKFAILTALLISLSNTLSFIKRSLHLKINLFCFINTAKTRAFTG